MCFDSHSKNDTVVKEQVFRKSSVYIYKMLQNKYQCCRIHLCLSKYFIILSTCSMVYVQDPTSTRNY